MATATRKTRGGNRKRSTAPSKRRSANATATRKPPTDREAVFLRGPTKHPERKKAMTQKKVKGEIPTAVEVRQARSDWGIEAFFTGKVVPIRPASRSRFVHARGLPGRTLCRMTTEQWVGGEKVVADEKVSCIYCLARIK